MSKSFQIPPYFIPHLPLPPPPLVTYKQFPSTKNSQNSQSSQIFPSVPQNTFTVFCKPPNSCSCAQTPSNEEANTQFSTKIELENITVEKRRVSYTRKKKDTRLFFSTEEDR